MRKTLLSQAVEACGRAGQWQKSLWLLAEVRDRRLRPDSFTLNAVMDALGRAGETEKALALLRTMRPAASRVATPARTRLAATVKPLPASAGDSSGGQVPAARGRRGGAGMRGGHPRADVFTWSGAMTACIEGGQWDRVVGMLEDMRSDQVHPNVINYNLAVKALAKGGQWEQAVNILEDMERRGVSPDARTYSAAIEACGRGGSWERAVSLMDDMRQAGLAPDDLTYSTVIAACDRGGAWDVALMMLDEARERDGGGGANVFAYTAAISACGKAGQWEKAISLLDVMRKDGVPPNGVTLRSALLSLENAPQPTPTVELTGQGLSIAEREHASLIEGEPTPQLTPDENRPSSGRFSVNGIGADDSGNRGSVGATSPPIPWEVAFSLLEGMAEDSGEVFPGPRDFSSGLTAACFGGASWASIRQMLDLMHTCAASAGAQHEDRFDDRVERGPPSTVSGAGRTEWGPGGGEAGIVQVYNHVIRVCGNAGGAELALVLVEEMLDRGVTPDANSYSNAIIACDLSGMWAEAVALLDDMRDNAGLEPDLVCYNCAVKACGSSGEWEPALNVFESMRARGIAPDEITYSSAIAACGNAGEARRALQLLKEMKAAGVSAGLIAHNAALGACDKGGEWEATLAVLADMRASGVRLDSISYSVALSSLDKSGEWRHSLALYGQLREDMAEDALSDAADGPNSRWGQDTELPSPRVTVAALTACARGGEWRRALDILREIQEKSGKSGGDGIWLHFGRASSLAFNAGLVACAKGAEAEAAAGRDGGWREAVEILNMMGRSPDLTSYGCAITACGFGGNVEACIGLLGEMLERNMTPTLADYYAALRACASRKREDAAQEILESMGSEGVEADARCYRFAAEAFHEAADASSEASAEMDRFLELAKEMEAEAAIGREVGDRGGGFDMGGLEIAESSGLEMLLEEAAEEPDWLEPGEF